MTSDKLGIDGRIEYTCSLCSLNSLSYSHSRARFSPVFPPKTAHTRHTSRVNLQCLLKVMIDSRDDQRGNTPDGAHKLVRQGRPKVTRCLLKVLQILLDQSRRRSDAEDGLVEIGLLLDEVVKNAVDVSRERVDGGGNAGRLLVVQFSRLLGGRRRRLDAFLKSRGLSLDLEGDDGGGESPVEGAQGLVHFHQLLRYLGQGGIDAVAVAAEGRGRCHDGQERHDQGREQQHGGICR